ncbi:methylated-DNA--protein-cysteine methyltransferase [Geotalea uraniireducens]|uniref:Methylated-DNA--protein-cysteine methyltransferase n=1 Tax=Geotalea uraniireducens TaxID=351604 RepID=A0ABM8EJC2_9BACT|nr:methylated-DNA--[protein]-cysteine S-methyltransferase [Geotalea uraniireducens]BDV42489.1 methylated-DNA--protein-cysteine methyltransferase [Geotalea uraniireducens]
MSAILHDGVVWWSIFATAVGFGGVVANEAGLVEVDLPFLVPDRDTMARRLAARYPAAGGENPLTRQAAQLLADYFSGRPVRFDVPLAERRFTVFQREVYGLVRQIPRGEVRTYGEIAAALGRPAAARGVGQAMARNPLPIIIPCHRVVGAAGQLTGYSGAGGVDSKRWLLALERSAPAKDDKGIQ